MWSYRSQCIHFESLFGAVWGVEASLVHISLKMRTSQTLRPMKTLFATRQPISTSHEENITYDYGSTVVRGSYQNQRLLNFLKLLKKYLHTHIHNWSLQSFSQYYVLASHTTWVVRVNFIYDWWDLQFKFDAELHNLDKLFHGNFI